MIELTESIKAASNILGDFIQTFLEAFALLVIAAGFVYSLIYTFRANKKTRHAPLHVEFRLKFGTWLVVALECLLGADIISTIINPTYEHLLQVAIIAVIRTFLNYFLNKEIEEEQKIKKEKLAEI